MLKDQNRKQETEEQAARERDIAEKISHLSERNQAMLEGFVRGLLASDVKQAG